MVGGAPVSIITRAPTELNTSMNNLMCQVILLYLLKFYFVFLKSLRNPVRSMCPCYSACSLQRGNGGWWRQVGNLQGKLRVEDL